jgi:predicted nucleotidyltransferase
MTLDPEPIVDELWRALDGLVAIYLFGSAARGSMHRASDLDIAVLGTRPLDPAARFDLQERLASRLGRDVDLVDLVAASPVMAIQVVTAGRLLYESDSAARGRFEDRTFGAYARLNEERRGILQRIADEGTVYGR